MDLGTVNVCAALTAGLRQGVLLAGAALVLTLPPAGVARVEPNAAARQPVAAGAPFRRGADFGRHAASAAARSVANWVADSQDNLRLPFVILDKREAMLFVFDAHGRVVGASPVLLGAAVGDHSVAGIGQRPIDQVQPAERTTPAGRFVSAPGKNADGEEVLWVDYDAAVSMHRVRLVDPRERRLERLASPDPAQRRISYGCINVPVAFFETVVWPLLRAVRGVVYVLPETRDARQVFPHAFPAPPGAGAGRPTTPL